MGENKSDRTKDLKGEKSFGRIRFDWHVAILRERLRALEVAPDRGAPWDEVVARITQKS